MRKSLRNQRIFLQDVISCLAGTSCDPKSWLSELREEHPYILASIGTLKRALAGDDLSNADDDDDMPELLAA